MPFPLLAEVEKLEKHSQELLAALAMSLKGAPLPPQWPKLARVHKMLVEIRLNLEEAPGPAGSSPAKGDAGPWGTAFQTRATPAAPAPTGVETGSVSTDWADDESVPARPASAPKPTPATKKTARQDEGGDDWNWDPK